MVLNAQTIKPEDCDQSYEVESISDAEGRWLSQCPLCPHIIHTAMWLGHTAALTEHLNRNHWTILECDMTKFGHA